MCDYSLYQGTNRLAVEGEELIVHRFPSGSIGLALPIDVRGSEGAQKQAQGKGFWSNIANFIRNITPEQKPAVPAVCVPPGTYLILRDIPTSLQKTCSVESEEGVLFVQTSATAHGYRDAVQFFNGKQVSLQDLREDQRLEVLSLASTGPMSEELGFESLLH